MREEEPSPRWGSGTIPGAAGTMSGIGLSQPALAPGRGCAAPSAPSVRTSLVLGQVLEPDKDRMPGKCPSFDQSLQ